ncbi:hypothetical protein EJ110_NYTH35916 [Nymphaea thermarum]|nr:hypothetical protein EJ110_NYTH35916 [Nymphaea thermarum]
MASFSHKKHNLKNKILIMKHLILLPIMPNHIQQEGEILDSPQCFIEAVVEVEAGLISDVAAADLITVEGNACEAHATLKRAPHLVEAYTLSVVHRAGPRAGPPAWVWAGKNLARAGPDGPAAGLFPT